MNEKSTKSHPSDPTWDEAVRAHRNQLIAAEQKSQDDYDKAVLSLSGGALAVSLVFLKDVVGAGKPDDPWMLGFAWGLWAASILAILASFFFSGWALRKACQQFDRNPSHSERAGGWCAVVTMWLNITGGALFVAGVGFMVCFALLNLEKGATQNVGQKATVTPTTPAPASPAAAAQPGEKTRGGGDPAAAAAAAKAPVRP